MKVKRVGSRGAAMALIALVFATGPAAADLVLSQGQWSTTFDCPAWDQTLTYDSFSCDGLMASNYANTCDGQVSHLSDVANNPSGGGGNGFREYLCAGVNTYTSTLDFVFSPVPELWVRWTMRVEPPVLTWANEGYWKLIYFNGAQGSPDVVMDWVWGTSLSLYEQGYRAIWHYPDHSTCAVGSGDPVLAVNNVLWSAIGDGNWHTFEAHFRSDTNGTDGVFQVWLDGVLVNDHSDVDYGGRTFSRFGLPSNQSQIATAGWVDFDDIVLSTLGYIGPPGGRPPAPPAAPTNLQVL